MEVPPWERKHHYHKLTFSMMYFYRDLYLLPFSHDEVVHGKKTIVDKIYGTYEEKFPQARTLYTYMMTHPGKKLNFMGNEIGQLREWDEKREHDWFMLRYPIHDAFNRYIRELNALYLTHPALSDGDHNPNCFLWLTVDAEDECVYIYQRTGGGERIITVLNFSGLFYKDFTFGLYDAESIEELLNSDWDIYGGQYHNWQPRTFAVKEEPYKQFPQQVSVDIPPFTGMIFKVNPKPVTDTEEPKSEKGKKSKEKKEKKEKDSKKKTSKKADSGKKDAGKKESKKKKG